MLRLRLQQVLRPSLTEEIAFNAIRAFFRDKPFVVFGTGLSCALDPRFGMSALENELFQNVVPDPGVPEQVRQWHEAEKALRARSGLETALDSITDPNLLQQITHTTGQFISSVDREYALKIAEGTATWPATGFFKRLIDTLPEGDPILHVLTPNYDTLFEHACDAVGIDYANGFFGGVERRMDWNAVNQSLLIQQNASYQKRAKKTYKYLKHARLYKVHGSLNYFFHHDAFIENNAWMWDPPPFANRVIITPGISKYQVLQSYRQELLTSADTAIDKANRFLFLGYGFNDTHLESYITNKLIKQGCQGLIVTRDSNSRIEDLIENADNLWLVCKMRGDAAIGTRIANNKYRGWLELPTRRVWDIITFKTEVLGE